ncbi:MAG: MBOAT family protein [Burkholderiaceae bacterium]|nr:MAG: MBOAT family protein [Burkholderiaceae bacterium]MCC7286451.1 MBOAT family protein [Burkholderiaceae bacterium]
MLFSSYGFIFLFLPITYVGYLLAGRLAPARVGQAWLIACSIAFYGIWNPINLAVIFPSIAVNYAMARAIRSQLRRGEAGQRMASVALVVGIAFNVAFLGYFKYKNFFLDTTNSLFGTGFALGAIFLPLGISFITFQKIAFLVDVRTELVKEFDLGEFLTFVFFFPQLIAGPIVHYREVVPQFQAARGRGLSSTDLAIGVALFSIGLFKKVVLADGIAPHANAIFAAGERGETLGMARVWMGVLAYTLQVYFDFSGYSDMAIGAARLFGIKLPMNFNSPLKSTSVIEFWNRWHITLTKFLTNYIYTPLLMRRTRARAAARKPILTRKAPTLGAFFALVAVPTILTMGLSGLWHGAGLTFVVWGLVHGAYLCINQAWRYWRPRQLPALVERCLPAASFVITSIAIVGAMVLFRAPSLETATHMLYQMVGGEGVRMPAAVLSGLGEFGRHLVAVGIVGDLSSGSEFVTTLLWLVPLYLLATLAPNSLQILSRFEPALDYKPDAKAPRPTRVSISRVRAAGARALTLSFSAAWAASIAALFVFGVLGLNRAGEFLYWQF